MQTIIKRDQDSNSLQITHFSLKLIGKVNGGKKLYFVDAATPIATTTAVASYLTNMYNKELVSKTHDIFEANSRTTQDLDLAAAMEKMSDVWSSK